jgi:FG-GAP-like repeat/FlgD Ig-like domain
MQRSNFVHLLSSTFILPVILAFAVTTVSSAQDGYPNGAVEFAGIDDYLDSAATVSFRAESFTDIGAGLEGVSYSSVAWGDYDNDGDLDVLLTGYSITNGRISCIYHNDAGTFTDIGAGLVGVTASSAAWGDYDNDGDLDVLLTGNSDSGDISLIYRNDAGTFTDIGAGLEGVTNSSVAWGDYDNDGDLDVLLAGAPGYISLIYRNDAGTFTDIGAGLEGVSQCSVAWGDYDNDGDLDVLLTGYNGSIYSLIYRNDAGIFTDIGAGLIDVFSGSVAWGDYDNDGDLDVLLTGFTGSGSISLIYSNDDGTFTDIGAGLVGVYNSSVAWGDYDNDGDLDVLLTGVWDSGYISLIYRNDAGTFTDIGGGLAGVHNGSSAWGDYDNDGDLDVLLTGFEHDSSSRISRIYRNNTSIPNTPPSSPTGLTVSWESYNSIQLQWDPSTDTETPQPGLNYNLRVGTTPGSGDICSAMALPSGHRLVPGLGNTNANTYWSILGSLNPEIMYYWSVQALDNCFAGSAFAPTDSFMVMDLSPLTDISADLIDVYFSSVAWGDYDNDGDLDVLLTGQDSGNNRISRIYRNDAGTFTDIGAGLEGVHEGSVAWGDYDKDGDLDVLLTGTSSSGSISLIYRNDAGTFTDIGAGLVGVNNSSVAWGDFDNDGDLDVLLTGKVPLNRISRIYRNDSGVFADIEAGLTGVAYSSVAWGDYDNDGDLDVLLTGDDYTSSDPTTLIYRNDAGTFTDIGAGLEGVSWSSAAWGDYDNDGDLDVLLTGYATGNNPTTLIYRNDTGTFTDIGAGLEGVARSSVAWGDFDNDGDLDVLLTGYDTSSNPTTLIYRNDAGTFTDLGDGLERLWESSVAWGDYDNDGDLDLLLTGMDTSELPTSLIYRNNPSIPNTPPSSPTGLTASWDQYSNSIQVQWNPSTDSETPPPGLTYNLRVGTTPGGNEICPPMALGSGHRTVVQLGNLNHNTSWSLNNQHLDDYYLSVQAVDATFTGSEFAAEAEMIVSAQLVSIQDVPGDQGRNLRLTWARSLFDAPDDGIDITGYEIYRREDRFSKSAASGANADQTRGNRLRMEGWDFVDEVPAHGESIYQSVTPTLCDSTAEEGVCWSVFFIRATTSDPFTFVDSPPDSGYSVDNLAPGVPDGFRFESPSLLAWTEVPDADFDYYSVYGSESELLDEDALLIGYTTDTELDITGFDHPFYLLTATDFNGNEGGAASAQNPISDVDEQHLLPKMISLGRNIPNPFNPSTEIHFDLPTPQVVELTVYDANGRRVVELISGAMPAGQHRHIWDGRDASGQEVASGIYLYRLRAGDFSRSLRMLLVR